MAKKVVKSISMDSAFYKRISRHARKKHMSASGWLAVAAEEKLKREADTAREDETESKTKTPQK